MNLPGDNEVHAGDVRAGCGEVPGVDPEGPNTNLIDPLDERSGGREHLEIGSGTGRDAWNSSDAAIAYGVPTRRCRSSR